MARAAALGVIPVGQGRFATEIGDGMLASVGPARQPWLYRQRSLLNAGVVIPGSSDRPVTAAPAARHPQHGQPPHRLRRPVQRRGGDHRQGSPARLHLGLRLRRKAEHVKGSIQPGKLADLAVLSEDPTVVSPQRIAALEVIATIVDGQLRYSALG